MAVFGLGDSISYGEYFVDAMDELYTAFKATGAKMVGHWPSAGYQHESSKVTLCFYAGNSNQLSKPKCATCC